MLFSSFKSLIYSLKSLYYKIIHTIWFHHNSISFLKNVNNFNWFPSKTRFVLNFYWFLIGSNLSILEFQFCCLFSQFKKIKKPINRNHKWNKISITFSYRADCSMDENKLLDNTISTHIHVNSIRFTFYGKQSVDSYLEKQSLGEYSSTSKNPSQ